MSSVAPHQLFITVVHGTWPDGLFRNVRIALTLVMWILSLILAPRLLLLLIYLFSLPRRFLNQDFIDEIPIVPKLLEFFRPNGAV
jgi:hypothetical protein